jgi:hypothetical protein
MAAYAGLYRVVRDHQTLTVAANAFAFAEAFAEDGPRFEFTTAAHGNPARMRLLTEGDEGNWYQKVEPAKPVHAELASLAGEFVSDEADVTFKVVFEKGWLVVRRPEAEFPLSPTATVSVRSLAASLPAQCRRCGYGTEPGRGTDMGSPVRRVTPK